MTGEPACCQVVTTVDSADRAAELAGLLVRERLAACVQVEGPLASTYRWAGEVRTEVEWRLVAKTTEAAYPRLLSWLRECHPYQQPEIIVTSVLTGDPAYLAWVEAETEVGD